MIRINFFKDPNPGKSNASNNIQILKPAVTQYNYSIWFYYYLCKTETFLVGAGVSIGWQHCPVVGARGEISPRQPLTQVPRGDCAPKNSFSTAVVAISMQSQIRMEDVIVEPDPGGKNNNNLVCKEKLLINSSYRFYCFGILIFYFVWIRARISHIRDLLVWIRMKPIAALWNRIIP